MAQDDMPHKADERPSEIVGLVAAMPHLAAAVDQFESEWVEDPDGPGLYLYVEVIWAWLNPLLESGSDIDPAFFEWLEELATSPILATRHFLIAGLLEVMGDNTDWLARLRRQMGPETTRASIEAEAFWGRPESERR